MTIITEAIGYIEYIDIALNYRYLMLGCSTDSIISISVLNSLNSEICELL